MKKQILSIALGLAITAIAPATFAAGINPAAANEKAVKNFNKQFQQSPALVTLSGDGFIVRGKSEGHEVTAAYDKKGNWVYTLTRYPSANLQKNIIDVVNRSYNNYYISGMEKVDQPARKSVFIVYMENQDSYKTLRVVDKEVELIHDFKKS